NRRHYDFREIIFRSIQMFPRTFREMPLQCLRNVPVAPCSTLVYAPKTLSRPSPKLFRSAIQLPFKFARISNLNAPAPAQTPYRNQFWLRAPLLLLVPAVLLVTFFAVRHRGSRVSAVVSLTSLQTNWQAAMDVSSSTAPESRRAVFPYSVI